MKAGAVCLATATLTMAAGASQAQAINGVYDGIQCNQEFRSELSLEIAWPDVNFYESQCEVTAGFPIAGMENTFTYDAQCLGEGEEFDLRLIITQSYDGGVIVIRDGYGQIYARCDS